MRRERKGTLRDPVNEIKRNSLDLLAVQHDEIVLADKEGLFRDQHQSLFFIVPMINPEKKKKLYFIYIYN